MTDALDVLAALLILLAGADWIAAVILLRAARRYRWPALVDRASTALALAFAATLIGFIAGARLFDIRLGQPVFLLLLIAIFMLVSLPSLVWLWAYLRGHFGERGE